MVGGGKDSRRLGTRAHTGSRLSLTTSPRRPAPRPPRRPRPYPPPILSQFPRWDLNKFKNVSAGLGSSMKSVGEVMSIGRNFPEAIQKAIRMATPGVLGFQPPPDSSGFASDADITSELVNPTDRRVWALAVWLRRARAYDPLWLATP